MTGTVLEEGLRGAGGYLVNGDGERFMFGYHEAGERATRDIVSRGIYQEMREGRTTPMGGVYISMAHLGPDHVAARFPGMVKRCRDCGFDLAGGMVEVVPTAHYMMGGVSFSADASTAIDGLFAAGEDCGGVHGANRLGGNGVANSTVFGGIAGDSMAAYLKGRKTWRDADQAELDLAVAEAEYPFSKPSGDLHGLREALSHTMWDDVGVMRDAAGLERGMETLKGYTNALMDMGVNGDNRAFHMGWHEWLNLKSLTRISEVIALAAKGRENSRGAHYREDFPDTGALEESANTVIYAKGDKLELKLEQVDFSIIKPGESLIEDMAGMPTPMAAGGSS
jgi:fumarate reductase flavoprotein subunit